MELFTVNHFSDQLHCPFHPPSLPHPTTLHALVWVGYVDVDGQRIPIRFHLEVATPEFTGGGRAFVGGFTVDGEGGPYPFTYIGFSWETTMGRLETDDIRILLKKYSGPALALHPILPIEIESAKNGVLGSGQLIEDPDATALSIRPVWVGRWEGVWTGYGGQSTPITIVMSPSNKPTANPPDFNLPFTAGKTGFLEVANTKMPFSNIVIDYFRREIRLTCEKDGVSLNLTGKLSLELRLLKGR